jgi:hypothetical protein
MSVLCDVFVSSKVDAARYASYLSEAPELLGPPRFYVSSFNGLNLDEFGALGRFLLRDDGAQPLVHLAHAEGGEWWIEQFDAAFVKTLTQIDELNARARAIQWSDHSRSSVDLEYAMRCLATLGLLARQSVSKQLQMFLWGSI